LKGVNTKKAGNLAVLGGGGGGGGGAFLMVMKRKERGKSRWGKRAQVSLDKGEKKGYRGGDSFEASENKGPLPVQEKVNAKGSP